MNEQPEALRLAERLEVTDVISDSGNKAIKDAAAELRRLHQENQQFSEMCAAQARSLFAMHKEREELVEALEEIHEEPFDGNDVCRIARVALAKAMGGEK